MGRYNDYLDAIEFNLSKARNNGIINLSAGTEKLEKGLINVNGENSSKFWKLQLSRIRV